MLDPAWRHLWGLLPSHVREVLGPKKGLLLLREMLVSAGYADESLVDDLARGFPLFGELPRSGTLPEVSYPSVEETRESLLWQAGWRNDEILSRVAASFVSDVRLRPSWMQRVSLRSSLGRHLRCRWRKWSSVAS